MKSFLRFLAVICKLLGLLIALGSIPFVAPEKGLVIFAVASLTKDFLLAIGDYLDDGVRNHSFSAAACLAIGLAMVSLTGCVSYTDPSGARLTSFLQKSTFEGLRVSPKTGLSVKSADTQGDTELVRSVFEAGVAAGKAIPK